MDPAGLIISVVGLLTQLVEVIRVASEDRSSKRRKLQDELHLFRTQLHDKLQFADKIKQQAAAVGFNSESLEQLQNELRKFIASTKELLSSKNCKKKDIQDLREGAVGKIQHLMDCIAIEMLMNSSEDVKAIKEMMAKKRDEQEMVSNNHDVHINMSFQSGNLMVAELLSFVTKTMWVEHFSKDNGGEREAWLFLLVGEVYYEGSPRGNSQMGYLAKGDTIGIGILRHMNDQHCIFFTLNRDLRMCIRDRSQLCRPSSRHGGLLPPVISLASAHVQVHVNFHRPFQLSDLLAQVKATLPSL
ncbi:hypothetical protein GOP47_0021685 [Adiantum capillus-veneris]|uniref:Rx N-terminal domain-containing protein n=1 Tax=Adiantum capillus-veneris TaxID=13818 RepID=A0A9D4U8V7_ADICA|nr:hypothetical protein GOP47_0021685 [Adiantum capillus-veneris]